jgi:Na+/proline symporter
LIKGSGRSDPAKTQKNYILAALWWLIFVGYLSVFWSGAQFFPFGTVTFFWVEVTKAGANPAGSSA